MKRTAELKEREGIVLSSMLFGDAEAKEYALAEKISDEWFTGDYQKIVRAYLTANECGIEPTETIIIDHLFPKNPEARLKAKTFFEKLREKIPPEPKEALENHILILKRARRLKVIETICKKTMGMIENDAFNIFTDDIKKIEHYVENSFMALEESEQGTGGHTLELSEAHAHLQDQMEKTLAGVLAEIRVPTGYGALDKVLNGGFLKGSYSIIAARPAMGKTVTMLNLAAEIAKAGKKVLFLSIEMKLIQLLHRLFSKFSGVESSKLQQPKFMNAEEWEDFKEAGKKIESLWKNRLWLDEVVELTPAQLERKIKKFVKLHKIDIVFVDYAQIMKTKTGEVPETPADYSQISGSIMTIAKAHDVHICVGSQVSREIEKRDDKRPKASDLRNSGAFEQDAAVIIGLYRDVVYNKDTTTEPNIIELIFLKNRYGDGSKTIKMNYDAERQSIFELYASA